MRFRGAVAALRAMHQGRQEASYLERGSLTLIREATRCLLTHSAREAISGTVDAPPSGRKKRAAGGVNGLGFSGDPLSLPRVRPPRFGPRWALPHRGGDDSRSRQRPI